jgi:dnd system-associated protein 4
MPDRRIRIPADKAEFVDELTDTGQDAGPFMSKADVLAFAAALGLSQSKSVPFAESAADPIRQEVFARQGYDTLINLAGVSAARDAAVLANSEEAENQRANAFEEFANGGLEILKEHLKGVVEGRDRMTRLVQMVSRLRATDKGKEEPLDIDELLS